MNAFSLKDIQQSFQTLLLKPSSHVPQWIISDQLSATDRLAIYSEGYRLRLCETLTNDFPATAFLMGEEVFKQWCLMYIDAHPSTHYSLRYFGKHFSPFLKIKNEFLLAELTGFEWALNDAFDALDAPTLTRNALERLPMSEWETVKFTLHPSVAFLTLASNAPKVWQTFNKNRSKESLVAEQVSTTWLIWRQALTLFFRPLTDTEHHALRVVQNKHSWHEVCNALAVIEESKAPETAAGFLNTWITDEILQAL